MCNGLGESPRRVFTLGLVAAQKPAAKISDYFTGPSDIIVTGILLFILVFNLVASLSPEIFYDTLIFHLGVPSQYKIYHGFAYLPFNVFSNMPMAHGMIYLFGMVLKDEIIAKLFNYFASVLIVLSIISFCRRFFNYRTGLWAAAIFYSIFHVAVCSWQAGTEMFLTLFTFLSLYLILMHEDTEWKYLALSGIFSGMCMALKYTGIYAIFVNLAVLIFKYRKVTWPYVKNAVLMGLLAAAVLSPWLVKNYVYVKNPVYPFATNIFPLDKNSDAAGLKSFIAETQQKAAFNLKDWFLLPFHTNTGSVPNNEYFTPLFLAILPFAWLLVRNRSAVYKLLYAYFGIFYLLWSFSTTVVRYLMPALPVGAVLIAFSLLWKKTDIFKKLVLGVMIVSFYASFLAGVRLFYVRDCWKVFFGYETKKEFLTNTSVNYPSGYYDMAAWLNENTKPDSKILLFGDARTLYYERKILANSVFDRNALSDYLARSRNEDELRDNLKKDSIGYIALNVVEAIRTMKDYKNFRMTDAEVVLYRKFFDKYLKEVYSKNIITSDNRLANKLVVYEIGDNPGPKQLDYITGAILPQLK